MRDESGILGREEAAVLATLEGVKKEHHTTSQKKKRPPGGKNPRKNLGGENHQRVAAKGTAKGGEKCKKKNGGRAGGDKCTFKRAMEATQKKEVSATLRGRDSYRGGINADERERKSRKENLKTGKPILTENQGKKGTPKNSETKKGRKKEEIGGASM